MIHTALLLLFQVIKKDGIIFRMTMLHFKKLAVPSIVFSLVVLSTVVEFCVFIIKNQRCKE